MFVVMYISLQKSGSSRHMSYLLHRHFCLMHTILEAIEWGGHLGTQGCISALVAP